jgi:hypothetical protein
VGQVLNETSVWWFNKTRHITGNSLVVAPDPNVTIARKCSVFPVEFVVRGYVTGTTSTSLWTVYNQGLRNYCGNPLRDGMQKNEKLEENILTPTTKSADHDLPVSGNEIVEQGLMSKEDFQEVHDKALALFAFGQVHLFQSATSVVFACPSGLLLLGQWITISWMKDCVTIEYQFWNPSIRGSKISQELYLTKKTFCLCMWPSPMRC